MKTAIVILSIIVLSLISATADSVNYHNPLIEPKLMDTYLTPEQNIKNILLLGIDKNEMSEARGVYYHTDAIMVLAVKYDEKRGDMISLPRDSVTYVPGKYYKGYQHLNGTGIMDYLRARTNATVNSNDLGRTGRQRDLMLSVFEKVMSDSRYLTNILTSVKKLDHAFFTNMSVLDMADYFRFAADLDTKNIGSYVLEGKYRSALNGWNFTFTDQANRQEIIRKVYGVKIPELKYVSYPYTKWLVENGFTVVRYLSVAKQLREDVSSIGISNTNAGQAEALADFDSAFEKAQDAFDAAADSMSDKDTQVMTAAGKELRKCGDALYSLFSGVKKPVWANGQYWYADRMINEIDVNFR